MTEDAIDERELIDGLRVVAKVTALCSELSVEADPERPHFFDMCSDTRMIGGPNPDGRYLLAMIRGDRAYRVTGTRGTTAYLGFQVLAGTGLTPRRMAGYLSDTELNLDSGAFEVVFSATEPSAGRTRLGAVGAHPARRVVDRRARIRRRLRGRTARDHAHRRRRSRTSCSRSPMRLRQNSSPRWRGRSSSWPRCTAPSNPSCSTQPNVLLTAEAAELGAADTTPDNLYMIGTFATGESDESLVLEFQPPDTRYWNVTLENIWHECLEPRHRHSSVTNKAVAPDADGIVRISIGAKDFGHGHWLDTGGRRRGFVILRWLDNPEPFEVRTSVRRGEKAVVSAERFQPDLLVEQACEQAGSDDFGGDDSWRDGLALLCDGLVTEARLNDLGVEIAVLDLVRPMVSRLQITKWRKENPDVAAQPISRPIFIVGQPRTGTTILFDLLARTPSFGHR